jgi:hypothetical protein
MNKAPQHQRRDKSTSRFGHIRCVWAMLAIIVLAASSSAEARAIKVVSGTYGGSCGAPHGNATRDFACQCDGRETCPYVVGRALTDHPGVGCPRDFQAEWLCTDSEFHTATLSPEAAGSTLVVSCVKETGAGK